MSNLDLVMHDINLKYKDAIVVKGTARLKNEKIPFTSSRANFCTYGGVPIAKICEFFGPEGSGKTTTALDIAKNAQIYATNEYNNELEDIKLEIEKLGNCKSNQKQVQKLIEKQTEITNQGIRKVVYVDAENTLDEDWARTLGVDTDNMILVRPEDQTAEQVLQMIIDIIKSGNVILLVLDSVPMLIPQQIYEQSMEKKSYCGVAGPMATFSSKISPIVSKTNCALLMINQVRMDINNPFNMYNTPGGKSLKHLFALRILFNKGSLIDENNIEQKNNYETPVGHLVQMQIAKTKVSKPDRKLGFYTLKYDTGVDDISDIIDMCLLYEFIKKAGKWFYVMEKDGETMIQDSEGVDLKFDGKAKLVAHIKENKILFEELKERVMIKLKD